MTATTVPVANVENRPALTKAIFALGRFEGRMMIRHPMLRVGALGAAGWAVYALWDEAPVLNRVSVTLGWTMLPLAFATAMVAGWAVLRAKGRSDANPPMVMPIGMTQRMGGIVVGLAYPAAGALVIQMLVLGWVMTRNPVTSIVWTEVLVGPLYVMFAGAIGAALTRWMPHPSTPLVAVIVLGGLMISFPYRPEDWGSNIGIEWLSPLVWPQDIIPYELAFRPAGLHLAYLVGLTLLAFGIATFGRWQAGWTLVGAGLVVAALTGPAQLGPIEESTRVEAMSRLVGDTAHLTCETHHGIDFCAMPGYAGWIDYWVEATQPVLAMAPPQPVGGIEVRQYPVHFTFILRRESFNNWWWVGSAYEDLVQRPKVMPVGSMWAADYTGLSVAGGMAFKVMGCQLPCEGQSQLVVHLWLGSQHPQTRSIVEEYVSGDSASVAVCMAGELWTRSDAQTLIHANWEILTAPETTYQEAGSILGLSVPTGYDENGYLETGCP